MFTLRLRGIETLEQKQLLTTLLSTDMPTPIIDFASPSAVAEIICCHTVGDEQTSIGDTGAILEGV